MQLRRLGIALVLAGAIVLSSGLYEAAPAEAHPMPAESAPTIGYLNSTYCTIVADCAMNVTTTAGGTLIVFFDYHTDGINWHSTPPYVNSSDPALVIEPLTWSAFYACEHPTACVYTVDDGVAVEAAEDVPAIAKTDIWANYSLESSDVFLYAAEIVGTSPTPISYYSSTNSSAYSFSGYPLGEDSYPIPMNVSCNAATSDELALTSFEGGDFHEEPPMTGVNASYPETQLLSYASGDGEANSTLNDFATVLGAQIGRWDMEPPTYGVPWASGCVVIAPEPTTPPGLSTGLRASPGAVVVGSSSTLTLSIGGGTAPVLWTLTKTGSLLNLSGVVAGSYTFHSLSVGLVAFYLNATDAAGLVSKSTTTVDVLPAPPAALATGLAAAPGAITVGSSSTLTLSIGGGAAPVLWTLTRTGSHSNLSGVVAGSYVFHSAAVGLVTFYLNATDAGGITSKSTTTVDVLASAPPPLETSLIAAPGAVVVGSSSTLTLSITGGTAPVLWTLTETGSHSNLSGVVAGSYVFHSAAVGLVTFYLNATDAAGVASYSTTTVDVLPSAPPPLSTELYATPGGVILGGSSAVTLIIGGGAAPVLWTLTRTGSGSNLSGATGGSYVFHPVADGTVIFYLNATDADGIASLSTCTVVTTSTTSGGGGGGPSLPTGDAAALVIVVLAVIAIVLAATGGRRRS